MDFTFLVRLHLFVSTMTEGVWQVPILRGTASKPQPVVKNAPNATDVQCDKVRRKVFWAKRGEKSTKILQADMEVPNQNPQVVFEHSVTFRSSHEGIKHLGHYVGILLVLI